MRNDCAIILNTALQEGQCRLQILIKVNRSGSRILVRQLRVTEQVLNQRVHSLPRTQDVPEKLLAIIVECCSVSTLQQLAEVDYRPKRLLQVVASYKRELLEVRI